MTREEIKDKLFDIIVKNSSPTMVVKRTIDYQQTMAIIGELITHEADLLKEFVGFVEDRLTIWIKDENYQANIAEAENDHLRKNTSLLIAETIEAIKNSMKPTLEKFWRRENEA